MLPYSQLLPGRKGLALPPWHHRGQTTEVIISSLMRCMTSESIRRGQQGLPLLQDPALPVYCMISTLVAHGTETEPQEATEREPDLSAGRIQIKGLPLITIWKTLPGIKSICKLSDCSLISVYIYLGSPNAMKAHEQSELGARGGPVWPREVRAKSRQRGSSEGRMGQDSPGLSHPSETRGCLPIRG